ncbi:MAG TPA: LLM class flavin-dependent oxidoreductase [Candidatus Dormibacteraeota bacterium]|nr:LLM class flavin-dependent oxidoreductase [Candidatus Dormibacteraeota bacterium]
MRFGLLASGMKPQGMPPPESYRELATRAEELGFDSLWVADRIASPAEGLPLPEGVATLGAFVGFTRSIRLGTSVLIAPLRHPALLAKQLATLDYLAEGRLTVGMAIGENRADYAAVGVPFAARGRRADHAIEFLRRAWGTGQVSDQVWLEPKPVQPGGPPIWVGGVSEAAQRRAGRLGDGWLAYRISPPQFADGMARVRREASSAGRDPDKLAGALMVPVHCRPDGEEARREAQESLSRRFRQTIPMQVIDEMCVVGTSDECSRRLAAYAEVGVEEVVLVPQAWSWDPVADAEEVFRDLVAPARATIS